MNRSHLKLLSGLAAGVLLAGCVTGPSAGGPGGNTPTAGSSSDPGTGTGGSASDALRITARFSGVVSNYPATLALEDTISVLLPYPLDVGSAYGPDQPDGPIPETFELKNAATTVKAINDVREGCPTPIPAGNPEYFTVDAISVTNSRVVFTGERVIPALTVGVGQSVCEGGTTTAPGTTSTLPVTLALTDAEWESAADTPVTFTDDYGWTWTITGQ